VHDRAVIRIVSEVVGYDLAKSFWKQPFIQFADSLVNVFFGSGNPALIVTVGHCFSLN
jgi:hypothetical protein